MLCVQMFSTYSSYLVHGVLEARVVVVGFADGVKPAFVSIGVLAPPPAQTSVDWSSFLVPIQPSTQQILQTNS